MSEKQGLPVDNSASPQTIPPAALRDIPGTLSFSTLLPKSPGQLLHPPPKVSAKLLFSVIRNIGSFRINELIVCKGAARGLFAR